MNALIKKLKYTGAPNEKALIAEMVKLSKKYPTNPVLVLGNYGEPEFYIYKNLSSVPVDTMATRSMLRIHGGFYMNGKIVKPTRGWQNKQVKVDNANYDH
jgi:hypothetical protein